MLKKFLLLLLLAAFSQRLTAQNDTSIIGKWKIIAVNIGVGYNYKKDSLFVTSNMQQSLVGRKDSAREIAIRSIFVRRYREDYFIFDDKLNYQELRNGAQRAAGTYAVNKTLRTIEVLYSTDKARPRIVRYAFEKNNLILYMPSIVNDEEAEYTLEKSQ